jgi:hypothetical protein
MIDDNDGNKNLIDLVYIRCIIGPFWFIDVFWLKNDFSYLFLNPLTNTQCYVILGIR